MTPEDQWAYQFVTKTCESPALEMFKQSALASFDAATDIWVLKLDKLKHLLKQRGVSNYLKSVMESNSLGNALEDCFSNLPDALKENAKDHYITTLMVSDFVGNTSGLVMGTVGLGEVISIGVKGTLKFGWAPLRKYLIENRSINLSKIKWIERITLVGAISIPSVYLSYKQTQKMKHEEAANAQHKQDRIKACTKAERLKSTAEIMLGSSVQKDEVFWRQGIMDSNQKIAELCD